MLWMNERPRAWRGRRRHNPDLYACGSMDRWLDGCLEITEFADPKFGLFHQANGPHHVRLAHSRVTSVSEPLPV